MQNNFMLLNRLYEGNGVDVMKMDYVLSCSDMCFEQRTNNSTQKNLNVTEHNPSP